LIEKTLTLSNRMGLHARPAAMLAQTAGRFKSKIQIVKDGVAANAKSVMGLMMLAAEFGSQLTLQAEGDDETRAAGAIEALFAAKFQED